VETSRKKEWAWTMVSAAVRKSPRATMPAAVERVSRAVIQARVQPVISTSRAWKITSARWRPPKSASQAVASW
jgi:hypothetical protein